MPRLIDEFEGPWLNDIVKLPADWMSSLSISDCWRPVPAPVPPTTVQSIHRRAATIGQAPPSRDINVTVFEYANVFPPMEV